jgi:hypothetical protein
MSSAFMKEYSVMCSRYERTAARAARADSLCLSWI